MKNTIISGVAVVALSSLLLTSFNSYTQLKVMEAQILAIERTMAGREETTKRFTAMMAQMDKTLAVQIESVNTLKKAVNRLEQGGLMVRNDYMGD